MEKTRRGQEDYPVVKTTQYLTGLTTSQDVWSEVGRALCSFFGADVVAFGERRADGEITTHHWTFLDPDFGETLSSAVEPPGQADVDQSGIGAEIKAAIAETLECGFLTSRLISTPESASIAFLPLIRENQVAAVMLVGHRTAEPLPKELLNVYLAVASLVGTTTARIASERELRKHRQHLETLVQQRTAELTQINERLQQEIIQRQRAEADHARASETLRKRIKELTCLYAVSRDMQQDLSVDELCRRAVEHLAPAMQFPEIAVPVIELNDSRFTRDGYRKGLCHSLQAEISVQGQVRGRVRVYYTEERPFSFPEEQNLVHAIAENLGRWIERKEAEREMRVKDEAIACAINAIAIADPQGNLTYVNPSFVDMWGYDEEQEVLGKSALDFWRRTEDAAEIMRSLQEGEGVVGELTGTRKDGSTFDAQLSASLVADNEGKPVCMMASFVDISERKRAEERVAHLNRVLRSIRDVNQLIVRETDPDRLIQGACDNLIETRGYHNAWIALFDESGELRATAEAGLGEGFSPLVEQFERGELPVCGQRALTQSSVAVIQDPPSSCTVCPLAANYGDRGAMTARLEHGETYYGLLTVSIPAHLAVDEEEQDLLQEVADDLAFALHDIQLEQERRRGEQALRESEKEYRRLIETLNEGIWRIDAEGHTTFVNPKMAEMLGHTVEEMEGEHLFAFMDDEWVEEAQDKLKRRQQGVTEVHEFTFRKKSGESAHMLLSTSSIFDERGEYAGALAGVTDITQRKRAEANVARTAEALRESEAVLNEAQEIAGVGSFVWDLRTDALRWSRHMFTIAGLDPDAFYANLQDTINNMIHPDDRASVQQQIAAMVEQKRTWPMEFRLVRPDGDVRWLRSGSRFTFDEQDTPIECIGVHHDITERKRAEEERARLTARVHEQAQQMAQVLATVPTGVVLLDAQGRILQANPTAEKDLVVLARANVGDVLTRLGKRPLAELLTPPPARGLWHEVKVNERTFEIIAQPVENGPQPKQWVLVINDATQEREIRAQLQQQERLAAVGQLAAGIAHDFNNIMAAIILYAQMAARSETLPQRDRERMAVIDQQARHATHLIEQILDFSRRAMLERRPLDLQPLLKEQVKLLKRTLPEHIGIELAYGREEYTVDADPTRMQQMLTNLAVNARDAMPDGGTLRIGLERIAVEPGPSSPLPEAAPGDWIRLTVSDTGTGIPADALPHIFEPFFTTKGPGEGSGLGLAQVHGIVGQHGGRVDVESQIGEGTTFVIYLPALEARPVEPSPTDAPIPPRGQGQVVLIVEDEGAVRTALVASLEQWNYRTLEATNGEEALDVMERQGGQVSLVLSDVVMPEMGGIALFRALRERGRRTPVILLTGHPMDKKDLDELWGQGLSACLTKPPNIERLAQAVADALQT